jgi:hypothetical protein
MSVIHFLTNRWAHSGYFTRTAAVIYMAPVAIWGVSAGESLCRSSLRLLHTAIALNRESRSYRWEQTQIRAMDAYGAALMMLISPIPILGTGRSYAAIFKMIANHINNTWELRDLQQRANTHAAGTLFQELLAWEPDIEKLISDAVDKAKPSEEQRRATILRLRATLIGRSWAYTGLFHLIEGSSRALRIVAIRVGRLISALFGGHVFRAIGRGVAVVINGANEEVQYACNLVDQPNRANVPERPVPNLYRDMLQSILEAYDPKTREQIRLIFAHFSHYRQYAITNGMARLSTDGPLPPGAPDDFFHRLRELPAACAYYSQLRTADEDGALQSILNYFRSIFPPTVINMHYPSILPYIENFPLECTARMANGDRKKKLLWSLSKELPNLREMTLDMSGIDPRWQMLIAVQIAKSSPQLRKVTFVNADERISTVMRRFCSWLCTIKLQ